MVFWIVSVAIAAAVAVFFYNALRIAAPQERDETDMAVFKEQLAEVDRDLARGVINDDDAKRLRTEISRRILTLDKQSAHLPKSLSRKAAVLIGATCVVIFAGGGVALYMTLGAPGYGDLSLKQRIENAQTNLETRPSQTEIWDQMPPDVALNTPEGEMAELVAKLRETVDTRPDDLEGHVILSRVEAGLGNYRAAASAKERVLALKSTPDTEDFFEYAEFLILSVNGYVSPQAEAALRAVLERDPNHGPALYYSGLMMAQNDRPDIAFRIWNKLLRDGPDDAPWLAPVREQIPELAFRAGINDFELPSATLKGPSAADIDAAADMTAGDRMDMIRGMVSQLSDRLATEGGSAAEWARLVNALGVLGDTAQAQAIYANAQEVFANDAAGLAQITAAAQQIGILE